MARHVRELAAQRGVPLGAVLEGGYEPTALAECVRETLAALGDDEPARVGGARAAVDLARRGAYRPLLAVVTTSIYAGSYEPVSG